MTSQEEENACQKIMASKESENVYQLPDIELHASTLNKSQEKDNEKEFGVEMTKNQKICVCLLASLVVVALSVAGIALLLTSIHFGIQNAMMESCMSPSNSAVTNQLNYSNNQIAALQAQQSTLIQQVSSILAKVIEADSKLLAVIRHFGQLTSCSDLPPGTPSGTYNIRKTNGSPVQVYCDMNRTSCSCNTTGGWMRVANLDMTDPNQNCPAGFRLVNRTSAPLRTCGRPGPVGCVSTIFQTYMGWSTHTCVVESLATRTQHQMDSPMDSPMELQE